MKIDVEGYECSVLEGAVKALGSSGLLAIIVETNGSGRRYFKADEEVVNILERNGLRQAAYRPLTRELNVETSGRSSTGNVLFIRDMEQARSRVQSAPRRLVLGHPL
jgi:hypothetical protein